MSPPVTSALRASPNPRKEHMKLKPGATIALVGCKAWKGTVECEISGLFTLEEFLPYEPAAHQHEEGWTVLPEGATDEGAEFFVDSWTLVEQTDPTTYAAMLVQEREMEIAAENFG